MDDGLLTDIEQLVLELVLEGLTNKEIGVQMDLSEKTIKYHMTKILKIHGLVSRAQLMAKVYKAMIKDLKA